MEIKNYILNYVSLLMLLVLTAEVIFADWKPDFVYDFLYSRIQIGVLYHTHAISMLAVLAAAYFMWLEKDSLPVAVFAAFGMASIHELSLDLADVTIFQTSSGVSLNYAAILVFFLIMGALIARPYHRKVWLSLFVSLFLFFCVMALFHWDIGQTIGQNGAPTELFYSPLTNAVEVGTWMLPSLLWYLPRRWFDWKLRR